MPTDLTPEQLDELDQFVDDAYRRDFRKVMTPTIGAYISLATERIRAQAQIVAELEADLAEMLLAKLPATEPEKE